MTRGCAVFSHSLARSLARVYTDTVLLYVMIIFNSQSEPLKITLCYYTSNTRMIPNHMTWNRPQLLEKLTDGLTSTSNNFSTETINVRLSSPDVPDLTVVDLPGIIRTSTAGQDPAVIAQVRYGAAHCMTGCFSIEST